MLNDSVAINDAVEELKKGRKRHGRPAEARITSRGDLGRKAVKHGARLSMTQPM